MASVGALALGAAGAMRSPRGERARWLARQSSRLRAIVAHAAARVPLYRRRWAGVDLAAVRAAADLARLPVITRRELRLAPMRERLARGVREGALVHWLTSGSSGEPLQIRRGVGEDIVLSAFMWRAWRSLGARAGDRRVFVTTQQFPQTRRISAATRRFKQLLMPTVSVNQPPERALGELRSRRPDVVLSYPSVLTRLAALALAEGRPIGARLVVSGGEVLSPAARGTIAAGFGGPVRDVYATHELLLLAWECPATGLLHVCDDAVVLELIDDGRPVAEGEEGDVVVTGLHSRVMPFVRYAIGDRAVRGPAPCPCGCPCSTLARVAGRRLDYYTLPDGRAVHHYQVVLPAIWASGARDQIDRYQVIQERPDLFVLRLATFDPDDRRSGVRFGEELRRLLGAGVEVRVDQVATGDFAPAGKFRLGFSRVGES
jgi:phenylacetate-CoA ligase